MSTEAAAAPAQTEATPAPSIVDMALAAMTPAERPTGPPGGSEPLTRGEAARLNTVAAVKAGKDDGEAAANGNGKAPVAAAKPEEKPPEAAKPRAWDALEAQRKARASIDKAKAEAKAEIERVRAESAAERAKAEAALADAKKLADELAPLREALSKKDFKTLMGSFGLSMVDVAHQVAEEGKPPTVEEIQQRATEAALAKMREEQAAAAEKATAEAKARAEREAEEAAKEGAEKFAAAVRSTVERTMAALTDAANADRFAAARELDELLPALGLDRGKDVVDYGAAQPAEISGGTAITRAAVGLTLRVLQATGEVIPPAEALERIQKQALPVLQKLKGQSQAGDAKKPAAKSEKKTSGGEPQPTLSTRGTAGSVTEPDEGDDDQRTDEAAVLAAARKALPHLAHRF